ncbi:hypothetical protein ACFUGD_01510 [Streptomyces sp. NPDC057217]|uniref:hypothetical protein n=1 Tax=Streptomyces sp. NPDC057217 TaxID=3346054 RepID=UPI003644DC2C
MLKKLLGKLALPSIDEAARKAFKDGDTVFAYKFHPSPSPRNQDGDIAKAIMSVEEIGWTLVSQEHQGEGLQRFVSLTFRRTDRAPAS